MDLREVRVQTGGRTDPDIAREILVLGGVDDAVVEERMDPFQETLVARYAELVPDDLSDRLAPGAADVLEHARARTRRCGCRSSPATSRAWRG